MPSPPRTSRRTDVFPVNYKTASLVLGLVAAYLAVRPTITQPAANEATTAAAITNLTGTVSKLESSVNTLSANLAADRTEKAGELAQLREQSDAARRDRDQLRAELRAVSERLDEALRAGERRPGR